MARPRVILFRTSHQEDIFESVFLERNWHVRSIPVLSFSYQNENKLRTCLQSVSSYQGIIVTSPRAGDFLAQRFAKEVELRDEWQHKTILCIGKRSAAQLVACGLSPRIAERADSNSIADSVIAHDTTLPWLFVCGNLRRDKVPTLLKKANVFFKELHVYHTHPHIDIPLDSIKQPDWVVFFSPSGCQAVKENWPASWKRVKKAAIGPTTAQSITKAGWKVDAIADKPEAEALFNAITCNAAVEDF